MQRAAALPRLHLGVQFGRDLQGVGVDADDGVQPGAVAVDGLDALQVAFHDIRDREAALLVSLLELPDGDLLQVDVESRLGRRAGTAAAAAAGGERKQDHAEKDRIKGKFLFHGRIISTAPGKCNSPPP